MAITTMDGLVAALNAGQLDSIYKATLTSKGAGYFHSLWKAAGLPGAGANPGSTAGAYPTRATAGAFGQTNPGGANKLYLAKLALANSVTGMLSLYDRLWANSTLVGNVATAQTFTAPTLTRYTDGNGIEAFLEIYTATGSTGVTATLAMTDTANASVNATAALIASPVAGQLIPFTFPAGCLGIKTCSGVTLSVTTGTAGDFGITLAKKLCDIPLPVVNIPTLLDTFQLGMPEIKTDACLFFTMLCTGAATGVIVGSSAIAEG